MAWKSNRPKYLPVNDTNTVPGAIVAVAVSTYSEPDLLVPGKSIHRLRSWSAISGRMESGKWTREKSAEGTEPSAFWEYLNFARQSGHPTTLVAYGVDRALTLLGFWSLLEDETFHLNREATASQKQSKSNTQRIRSLRPTRGLLITGGPPTAVICYHRDRWKLTCVDVQNYIERSESDVAGLVDCPYSDWPAIDASLLDWSYVAEQRCRATCDAFVKLVTWQNQQEFGMFSLTITSLAMAALRHRFMRDKIELPQDQDERDWQRQGYFSGRIEALWAGSVRGNLYHRPGQAGPASSLFDEHPIGPFHLVDARSFYAAVETFEEVPIACIESYLGPVVPAPPDDESMREIMATVVIKSETDTYPVRCTQGTVYATGEYQTTLAGPELCRAVRAGHVQAFLAWQRYALGQPLRWYAEGVYAERERSERDGDRLTAALCKALLARLHGKFLQRSHRWSLLPGRQAPGPWQRWDSVVCSEGIRREFRSIGWDVEIRDPAGDHEFCFPAIAAWVTSHGREYLRHWQQIAGPRHVLYLSCDGMIVDQIGLDNLTAYGMIYPSGVGSLRVVRGSPDIDIRGPNNYSHAGHDVRTGRPHRDLVITESGWRADRWQGLEELFLATDKSSVASHEVTGRIGQYTASGVVGAGGWITPPRLRLETQTCPMTMLD